MPITNQKEEIDSRILRIIGLEDVFDLDYGTYLTLLKEAMVKGRMSKSTIPTEEIMLLTDEYKKVKSKKDNGRFQVKKKNITATSFNNGNIKSKVTSTKALPGTAIGTSPLTKSLEGNITALSSSIVSISQTLKQQKKISDSASAYEKRKAEQEKRSLTENRLEKRFEGLKKVAEKIIAPVKSLLDKILQFFTTVILGRIVYKLVEWLGDEKNASKVKSIIRFVKDWWPALLGSYILFGTSFGKFIRGTVSLIGRFIFQIGKVAIPKLLGLIRANPLIAAGVVTGLATGGAEMWRQKEENRLINKEARKRNVSPEVVKEEKVKSDSGFLGLLGQGFSKIGPLGYAGGGLASGYVSGEKGVDKVPAMLSDGEFVMSVGAVEKYGVDTLEAMNAAGGGTNKPKIINGKTYAYSGGRIGKDPVKEFIKYKLGYDVDRPETWGASFSGGISGISGGSIPNVNLGRIFGGLANQAYGLARSGLDPRSYQGLANQAYGLARSGLDPRSYQGLANQAYGLARSGLDPRSYRGLIDQGRGFVKKSQGLLGGLKNRALGVLDSPLASLEKYGTERESALMKSGELKSGESLTKTTQKRLADRDAYVKGLYDPKRDKGPMGAFKKRFQDIQNKGLFADPFAALGLKEAGTEKFVEKITGGRVKNLGAKITGLQYALKGLAGPLGSAFRIDDRGSLGRYVRPAMLEAQRRGQGGVGAVGLGQKDYNRLMGDKLANLALGQFGFKVDKDGRAKTNDVYDSNKPASEYFKKARSALKSGNVGGALFQGLSGVLRINQNTGWGNLRPGGSGIDLGGGFTPTDNKGKPIPPTKSRSPVTMYGSNDPRRRQSGPYQSRFSRPRNAGVRPVRPPAKPRPTVVSRPTYRGGGRGSGSRPTSQRPPSFSATTRGSRPKANTLGIPNQASYR